MTPPTTHEHMSAKKLARGKATADLLEITWREGDPRRRRLAAIALGLRHPIYAKWRGRGKPYVAGTEDV